MNSASTHRLWIILSFTSALLGLLLFFLEHASPAAAHPLGVLRSYPGGAPCNTTLQACIDGSANTDSINIAAGSYNTSVTVNKAVILLGAGAGSTLLQAL